MNRFLARVGLKLVHVRAEKRNGRKIRLYCLPKVATERMLALAASYTAVKREKEEELETGTRAPPRDRSPRQGTEEKIASMNTNKGLLSLLDSSDDLETDDSG
jgi:hypothetical protein